jgi:hypothetical protein
MKNRHARPIVALSTALPAGFAAHAIAVTIACSCVWSVSYARDTASDVRYTDLLARLGAAAPTGAGIGVGQIEANEGSNYTPDQTLADFSGTAFVVNGSSPAASWHATEVGKAFYGNTLSIAPGITNVWCWSASPYVTTAYLKVGSGGTVAPSTPPTGLRVFNHSWIGSFGSFSNDNDALRRLDFAINRDQLTVVAGVNNGAGSAAQPMMAYSYNGIAVGLPNGAHSNSLTPANIDGPNRRKPDMVAPGQFTSFATPVVGAAAALLWDTADSHPNTAGNGNAARAVTVKAALMAGTQHRAGWSNGAPESGASKGITTTPLDAIYGADLLDINRSHLIYTGGEATGFAAPQPSTFERHAGWDYIPTVVANTSVYWSFRVHQPVDEVSVVATWHRLVATNFGSWTLQDFDLRWWKLVNGVPTSISGAEGAGVYASGNVESNSTVDNAEHLFIRNLAAGDYVLELKRKAGSQLAMPVCVAWYIPETVPSNPADLDNDGSVGAADLALLLSQWGTNGSADLSGNGSVGAEDLSILLASWG